MTLKEAAIAKTTPLDTTTVPGRYKPEDTVLAFLNSL